MQREAPTLAIHALVHDPERLRRVQGTALNAMVDHIMDTDPNYPLDGDANVLRNYKNRVRRIAHRELVRRVHEEQNDTMTRTEYERRVEAVHSASAFANAIMANARTAMQDPNTPQHDPNDSIDIDFDKDFDEITDKEDAEQPQQDLEDDVEDELEPADGHVMRLDQVTDGESASLEDIPYKEVARSFITLTLNNTLRENKPWIELSVADRQCKLCVDDDTVDGEDKYKEWSEDYKLRRHQAGTFHSMYEAWVRWYKRDGPRHNGKMMCPYCIETDGLDVDDRMAYPNLRDITRHIRNSSPANSADGHDDLKAADGWYEDEWSGDLSEAYQQEIKQIKTKRLAEVGVTLEYDPELPGPVAHPSVPNVVVGNDADLPVHPGIVMGFPPTGFTMNDTNNGIEFDNDQTYLPRDGITFVMPPQSNDDALLPDHPEVVFGPPPPTAGKRKRRTSA